MKPTENGVFCGSGQQQINYSVPLGVANAATSIRVELQASGYSAGCGEFSGIDQGATEYGNLTLQFNIDNQWGANLPRTMVTPGATDFRLTSHVQNEVPYDNSDWKGQLWWSFHNFNTASLSRPTFAATFVDAPTSFGAIGNWADGLFYDFAYKDLAKGGNCFGMVLDSIDAQFGQQTT